MDARTYLARSDARQPDGRWPNPRWHMTDPAAIAQRLDEDGRRIAAEKGDCTPDDLTRLGWRQDQVKARQACLAAAWDRLDAEIADLMAQLAAIGGDDHPTAPALADDDIAFGIERAA